MVLKKPMLSLIFIDLDNQKINHQELLTVFPKLLAPNPLVIVVANDHTLKHNKKLINEWRINNAYILASGTGSQVSDSCILVSLSSFRTLATECLIVTRDFKLLDKINKSQDYCNILKHFYNKQDKTFITKYKQIECKVIL